jgi:transposase-like protein
MLAAGHFLSDLLEHGKHPVSTDCETWYPQACRLLRMEHHLHSPYEKSIIERTMQCSRIELNALMTIFHAKEEMQTKAHNQLVKPFHRFSQQGIEALNEEPN